MARINTTITSCLYLLLVGLKTSLHIDNSTREGFTRIAWRSCIIKVMAKLFATIIVTEQSSPLCGAPPVRQKLQLVQHTLILKLRVKGRDEIGWQYGIFNDKM